MPAKENLIHGWVSTDCGRGTSDILWSCLATVLLCVWTVIHLPVPLHRGQQLLSTRQKLVRSGIGPALISVIAPEFLAFTAVSELIIFWFNREEIRRLTQIDWTLTHQFFLDMGGACLMSPSGRYLQIGTDEVIGAIKFSHKGDKQTADLPDWILELKKLTEDQIKDLAKSDTLSKLIGCGQALWLITQVVSRVCQHQAVTLLEVSTCAYVLCALISYTAWWKKPQGCTSPIMITCSDDAMSKIVTRSHEPHYYETETWDEFIWAGRHWFKSISDSEYNYSSMVLVYIFPGLTGLCPTIFGAIHVASWNIILPSDVELWMWRTSSIYCLVIGPVVLSIALLSRETASWIDDFWAWSISLLAVLYIIVRVFMIVEIFLSLRALPASAFESVQWSSFLPHV